MNGSCLSQAYESESERNCITRVWTRLQQSGSPVHYPLCHVTLPSLIGDSRNKKKASSPERMIFIHFINKFPKSLLVAILGTTSTCDFLSRGKIRKPRRRRRRKSFNFSRCKQWLIILQSSFSIRSQTPTKKTWFCNQQPDNMASWHCP